MKLSRRASWLLIAFALWSWFIWVTLIKNISNDSRSWGPNNGGPTAFLAVHVVLAIISIGFGTAIGWLGWRGLRALNAGNANEAAIETALATVNEAELGNAPEPEPVLETVPET